MSELPVITALTLLPLFGGLIVLGIGENNPRFARGLALTVAFLALGACAGLWFAFDSANGTLQFQERYTWIQSLNVDYHVGADGLSLLLLLLTGVVMPMAMLASWGIQRQRSLYFGLMLLLETGLFGTFTALNFFHWFLFWELSLIPAFFLVKLWGGPFRTAAATQFFVYTMAGSVTLLLAFLAIYLATGTFDFLKLAGMGQDGTLVPALAAQFGWGEATTRRLALVLFGGVFLGFAVKVPLMPFHTWLPVTYTEASTGTTMVLTGVMSKMGLYGFVRILLPIFPEVTRWVLTPLLWLAVATIVFSAGAALAQRDIKRVLAYSSINHLGYCLLGLFAAMSASTLSQVPATDKAAALNGAFLQMFNHGLTAATLFCFAGFLESRGNGLRGLDDFGGLRAVAPVFCGLMGIALFASLGLPGLNGFVGEFLIFRGSFPLAPMAAATALLGLLLTAVFILGILQRLFFGPVNSKWSGFADLSVGERMLVAPPLFLMLLIGVYPQMVLGIVNSTTIRLLEVFGT